MYYSPTVCVCTNSIRVFSHMCSIQDGHLSSTGQCFDCGMTVRSAVIRFSPNPDRRRTDEPPRPFPGSVADWAAGNGSLMRLCPVPLFFHKYPEVALDRSMDSSKVTHGADAATDSCRYTYLVFCFFLLLLLLLICTDSPLPLCTFPFQLPFSSLLCSSLSPPFIPPPILSPSTFPSVLAE